LLVCRRVFPTCLRASLVPPYANGN
jgi:hypothetical protein